MDTRIKDICSIALAGALLFNISFAVGKEKPFTPMAVYGEGTASCGSYVESKNDEIQRYIYLVWLNGYLTAFNQYQSSKLKIFNGSHDIKKGLDSPALMLWLENYCRENPLDTFVRAVMMLRNELKK